MDIATYRLGGACVLVTFERLEPGSIRLSARLEIVVTFAGLLAAYVPMKEGVQALYHEVLWVAEQAVARLEEMTPDDAPFPVEGRPELVFRAEQDVAAGFARLRDTARRG